ncbi:ubiquitin carboxyl-terminal hydrolase 10 [Sitophilus oryzae]|uniref:ubiquitinyl hydrolase 1 n=1 Tax=Sitophilus oryzae TaxID=7048 RepID=A0A6J2X5P5_SITOR|nr:ubiquitin carboxyl-terminal hydrolase 10 [Sitophilus oryzae]
MEFPGTLGLQFLDLSGVDEFEKDRVLNSLQPTHKNSKFPWIIGHNNDSRLPKIKQFDSQPVVSAPEITPRRAAIPIINPENGLPIPLSSPVSEQQVHTVNSPVNSHQYFEQASHFSPQTTSYNVHYQIASSYANIHNMPPNATPVYYTAVAPGQPIFVSYPSNVQAEPFYPNTGPQYVQNVPVLNNNVAPFVNSPPVEKNIVLNPPVQEISQPDTRNVTVEQEEAISLDSNLKEALPKPEDSVPKQAKAAWGSGKSWASLFTPKKDDTLNGSQINGITRPTFEAVTKEPNLTSCPIKNPRKNCFVDPDCYRMGEFLSNYSLDGRTISLQPRGLINQSNYCYINSILQALIACPPMYNLLSGLSQNISSNEKRKPTPVIDGMCKFVKEFKHLPANMRVSNRRSDGNNKKDQKKDQSTLINTDIPFEPSWIYKMLNGIRTDLIEGRQEDAEEFLGCLLNNLNDEMIELIKLVKSETNGIENSELQDDTMGDDDSWQIMGAKNKGSIQRKTVFEKTPITDIFGGSLKSKIHRAGDLSTENTQPFLTLQLNIEKVKTVCEALEALTTKYQLEGLTSSKTNQEVEAWQQVMLDELPVVLVLHLKCFDYQLDGCTKIIKALEFPIDLKIDTKLLSLKTNNAKEKQYKLFAVVYHDGKEATKGHYVTDAFHVGYSSWLRYDDSSVKQVQEEQVLNPQGTRVPYLLFYRRSDTFRSR